MSSSRPGGFDRVMAELAEPRKRKALILGVVVFLVVLIALVKYHDSAQSARGDVIVPAENGALEQSGGAAVLDASGGSADIPASAAGDSGATRDVTGAPGVPSPAAAGEGGANTAPGYVFVDVGGAVQSGGVIAMPTGSRVADAIAAAGGLTEAADVRYLNRAAVLSDGDRIYVPTTEELRDGTAPPTAGQVGAGGGSAGNSGVSGADSGGGAATPQLGVDAEGRVNINTADSDTLQILSGVGPAIAQKIIDYRTKSGGFKRIEDLMNVSGIGQKTFEKLRDHITV